MRKSRTAAEVFSVDRLMQNTAAALIRDFQTNLNDPCFCSDYLAVVRSGNVARMREVTPAADSTMDIATYKATYQIGSVMKRYRYENDTYSDAELAQKAMDDFRETQNRLSSVNLDTLGSDAQRVLDLAASYIAHTLGEYSDEEHRSLCRFGRRASVGVPAAKACLAERWELPISGSSEQISWFDSEMSQVASVMDYWQKQLDSDPLKGGTIYRETSSLKLTLVPKTFKSLRAIMPNTTIGSYMSFGLGEMIRKRLKRAGYDIRSLQMRHRYLARQASCHSLAVTADLSSASDSITVALVERLFPADWVQILHRSRIGVVDLPDGTSVVSKTYCTMGIGYTFPLQTLVFLALLKAIEATLYNRLDRRTISVYGDDMIYSSRMHSAVVRYFPQFGFVINLDKTFHEGHFRESCGGDYYHGVDVRPFQPRNGSATVGKRAYEAILYKYVNGLLARWSEYEIAKTLLYLVTEIESVASGCKLVPCDYPDDSGIKCPGLGTYAFLRTAKVANPVHLGHGVYRFSYLRLKPEKRKEARHEPYYWEALRGIPATADSDWGRVPRAPDNLASFLKEALDIREDVRPLRAIEDEPVKLFRSCITGERLRRTSTYVTISNTGRYTRQSGTSCFEVRR